MAFYDVAQLQYDTDFRNRVTACYVTESPTDAAPMEWTVAHIWQIASAPGFGDKYAYAVLTGIENPGRQESVISDNEILAAVQAVLTMGATRDTTGLA